MEKLAMAADHAGFEMKEKIKEYVTSKGYEVKDYGTYTDDRADYPDFAHPLAVAVEENEFPLGLTFCGSGNGINITANKHAGIRSALCWTAEISALARAHNDANVCAIPARFVSFEEAKAIVDAFLSTPFDGGRHQCRVDKIPIK